MTEDCPRSPVRSRQRGGNDKGGYHHHNNNVVSSDAGRRPDSLVRPRSHSAHQGQNSAFYDKLLFFETRQHAGKKVERFSSFLAEPHSQRSRGSREWRAGSKFTEGGRRSLLRGRHAESEPRNITSEAQGPSEPVAEIEKDSPESRLDSQVLPDNTVYPHLSKHTSLPLSSALGPSSAAAVQGVGIPEMAGGESLSNHLSGAPSRNTDTPEQLLSLVIEQGYRGVHSTMAIENDHRSVHNKDRCPLSPSNMFLSALRQPSENTPSLPSARLRSRHVNSSRKNISLPSKEGEQEDNTIVDSHASSNVATLSVTVPGDSSTVQSSNSLQAGLPHVLTPTSDSGVSAHLQMHPSRSAPDLLERNSFEETRTEAQRVETLCLPDKTHHSNSIKSARSQSNLSLESLGKDLLNTSGSFSDLSQLSTKSLPTPCTQSVGTSSHQQPCLVRKKSTANILLTLSPTKTSERGAGRSERKIRVIKSAANFQRRSSHGNKIHLSRRLDEWLRSVMKLQSEMASQSVGSWPFPDEESPGEADPSRAPPPSPRVPLDRLGEDGKEQASESSRRLSSPLPRAGTAPDEFSFDETFKTRPRSSPVLHLDCLEVELEENNQKCELPCVSSTSLTPADTDVLVQTLHKRSKSNPLHEKGEKEKYLHPGTNKSSTIHLSHDEQDNQSMHVRQRSLTDSPFQNRAVVLQRRWSTTGINTDITAPTGDGRSASPLCGFCKQCYIGSGELEVACASARLNGICCACRRNAQSRKVQCAHSETQTTTVEVPPRNTLWATAAVELPHNNVRGAHHTVESVLNPGFACVENSENEGGYGRLGEDAETRSRRSGAASHSESSNTPESGSFGSDTTTATVCRGPGEQQLGRRSSSPPVTSQPAAGITIRVTREEEERLDTAARQEQHQQARRTPSAFRVVRETSPGGTRDAAVGGGRQAADEQSPTTPPQTTSGQTSAAHRNQPPALARGTSPHYMFPSSSGGQQNPAEDDFLLRHPLSPRNSVGSISSVLSYKSSNADSAVDLCPPDDDHDHDQDFEFDKFLAKHQGRQGFAAAAGRQRNPEQPPDWVSCMDFLPPGASAVAAGPSLCPQKFPEPRSASPCTVKPISPLLLSPILTTSNSSTPVPDDNPSDLSHLRTPPREVTNNGHMPSPPGTTPKTEIAGNSGNLPPAVSTADDEKFGSSREEGDKQHAGNHQQSHHTDVHQRCARKDASPPRTRPVKLLRSPTNDDDDDNHFQPVVPESSTNDHSHYYSKDTHALNSSNLEHDETQPLQPIDNNASFRRPQQQQQQLPELIISDFSGDMVEEASYSPSGDHCHSPVPLCFSPDDSFSDSDSSPARSQLSSPNMSLSSGTYTPTFGDLLQVQGGHTRLRRTSSASSVSSEGSTCSTCSFVSDSEKVPKKTSSWRKIRSFILWSPFIQVFKKHRYPWIQLAGHQGNFHAGEAGSVLKKLDPREQACFQRLMADPLKDFVPEYSGDVERNGEMFIQLQDLLASFSQPCVMDVKMGVRTYLEAELEKARRSPTLRKDMYQKMVEVDSNAPTEAEHDQRAVTKPRYMQWRDQMSSSTELGFRVEGIKKTDGSSTKDFKKTKTRQNIVDIVTSFVANNETIAAKYIKRLKDIMAVQESSDFFRSHEVVGSSLLFVHDAEENVGVWMIDFGKTDLLPSGKTVDHRSRWEEGNREDGYLYGLDNLVSIFEEVHGVMSSSCV